MAAISSSLIVARPYGLPAISLPKGREIRSIWRLPPMQNLRSSSHPLQSRQYALWTCEDELSLALAPCLPSVETVALYDEVGHHAQRDMVLLGTLPWQG